MTPKDVEAGASKRVKSNSAIEGQNPRWWVPTALTLMVVGLFWVISYYVASGSFPIPGIGGFNIGIGFVLIMAGFIMLTQWK